MLNINFYIKYFILLSFICYAGQVCTAQPKPVLGDTIVTNESDYNNCLELFESIITYEYQYGAVDGIKKALLLRMAKRCENWIQRSYLQ